MLMDSASVMRGHKTGLEVRIREVAPQLLDIDGDACHHMHNIVKQITKPFKYFLERLFRDLFTDFKHAADSCDMLAEVAYHLGVTFRNPDNYIGARWLSVQDSALGFDHMKDVYSFYYLAISIDENEREAKRCASENKKKVNSQLVQKEADCVKKVTIRKKEVEKLLAKRNVSVSSKGELEVIQKQVVRKAKTGTKKGKARKQKNYF